MKKGKLVFILLFLSIKQTLLLAQPEPQKSATIHLYQGKVFGLFSAKYRIYANGKLLCKLGRNSHCQIVLPAGQTTFTTKPPFLALTSQPALSLNLEAGKEYYLQGDAKFELFPPNGPLVLTEVVPNPNKLDQINHSKTERSLLTSVE
ncbi:hypothetical protein [Spirosoma pollinicola]|uniref:DUF2846 domain-containing protein n=1 Tax=Spirosoma pollinicola TaxID=2057025 RepID=A0A2K8Z556_9BACT|nr:hypothetical protein [Spirosoma pollinicola]AUD05026.1 hypothetical protein CWM47_26165 [Spirosoma pollinicola]